MSVRSILTILTACVLLPASFEVESQAGRGESVDYPLAIHVSDPSGDSVPGGDIVSMTLAFNNATGAYEIMLRSAPENPFEGNFRVNINLFNPDVGTTVCDASRLSSTFNDFSLVEPQETLLIEDTSTSLQAWSRGDRVATTSTPFGNPDCVQNFSSGLLINGVLQDTVAEGDQSFRVFPDGPVFTDRFEVGDSTTVNQLPVAGPSRFVILDEDQAQSIALTGSDADGDTLTFEIVDSPSNGALTALSSTGSTSAGLEYTPDVEFSGDDSFTYRASDGTDSSQAATIDLFVEAVNDPPQAAADSATTDEDTEVTVDVLANDSDIDGSLVPSSVTISSAPSNGSTSIDGGTGAITYTPDADYFGEDTFDYQVCDDGAPTPAGCATATVTLTVNALNDPPQAAADSATTNEDTEVTVDVLANDSDIDGSLVPSSVTISSAPSNGSTSIDGGTGAITYTPAADYFGEDTFDYQVCDDGAPTPEKCANASVTVTVDAVNDAPSFSASDPPPVDANSGSHTVSGWATFTDPGAPNESDQSVLGYDVSNVEIPALFTAGPSVSADGTLAYEVAGGVAGDSTFDVTVSDDGGTANGGADTSSTQTFTITVNDDGGIGCCRLFNGWWDV